MIAVPVGGIDTVPEGISRQTLAFLRRSALIGNDPFQFLRLLGCDEGLPFRIDFGLGGNGIHELLDKVLLVAQAGAGIDRTLDVCADFLVLAGPFAFRYFSTNIRM